jgi:3-oxoacyl-[acyl-carrier protein] reductase
MKGNPLEGRTGLVTGANRGIGRALCLAFAGEGMNVVASARAPEDREALAAEIESRGGGALVVGCDVANEDDIRAMVEKARESFGKVDFAVCNAGVLFQASVAETTTEDWDYLMSVNLRGVFLTIRECLRVMPETGGSKILIISSNSGKFGQVGLSAYCAAKHGLMGLADSLSQELRETETSVHVICPGRVATDMARSGHPDPDTSSWLEVEDIANAAIYLLTLPPQTIVPEIFIHPRFQIVPR